jgi:hypothetical protein
MPIRILVFGTQGDGSAYAAMAQVRSLIGEMHVDASVQIITDPSQLASNGVDAPPAVSVDGFMVSNGWVPSRNELARAIRQRQETMSGHPPQH